MKLDNIVEAKYFKWILIVVGQLILLILVFNAGMFIGFHKANFSYRWRENYDRNFGGPRAGPERVPAPRDGFWGRGFINPHGTTGTVISIDNNVLVIKGQDNTEKTIIVAADTAIRKDGQNIKLTAVKIDDTVVVIGRPDNAGQIEAKFIRVFAK